ncbi:hypothetical protein AB4Y63_17760 [Leifsonia sp. YAF41]|uniref:hypothetical protein n=1 Tax=Leifsonia sp. YAF41 TaxID=3233086 RepID=UPI003F972C28
MTDPSGTQERSVNISSGGGGRVQRPTDWLSSLAFFFSLVALGAAVFFGFGAVSTFSIGLAYVSIQRRKLRSQPRSVLAYMAVIISYATAAFSLILSLYIAVATRQQFPMFG